MMAKLQSVREARAAGASAAKIRTSRLHAALKKQCYFHRITWHPNGCAVGCLSLLLENWRSRPVFLRSFGNHLDRIWPFKMSCAPQYVHRLKNQRMRDTCMLTVGYSLLSPELFRDILSPLQGRCAVRQHSSCWCCTLLLLAMMPSMRGHICSITVGGFLSVVRGPSAFFLDFYTVCEKAEAKWRHSFLRD